MGAAAVTPMLNRRVKCRESIDKVEKFLLRAYENCNKAKVIWQLLSSDLGQKYFRTFLRQEGYEDWLSLFNEITEIQDANSATYIDEIKRLCDKYISCGGPVSISLRKSLCRELNLLDMQVSVEQVDEIVDKILNQIIENLASDFLIPFLHSKLYSCWRAIERSHASAITIQDLSRSIKPPSYDGFEDSITPTESSSRQSVCSPRDLSLAAFSTLHESCVSELLGHRCEWLISLLSAVEGLPMSVFLCKASGDFPLVFVNKHFQSLHGFRSSHVLGKSIVEGLLCRKSTKRESIERIEISQKRRSSCVEKATFTTFNGAQLDGHVAFKPISDGYGKYAYVLGMQIAENEYEKKDTNIDELLLSWLESLPDSMEVEDESPRKRGSLKWFK